ncbi:MAG: LPD29 domain-containing protein [Candidatus Heimdallarchaeaceae archaeon]
MEQLTQSQKIELGTKEIAKRIRQQLKSEFPRCKFSVRTEYFSGGSSITISLMVSDRRIIRHITEIPEEAFFNIGNRYTKKEIAERQKERYHQLNHYALKQEYDPNEWCNGVFLTEQGHNLLKRVVEIAEQYNYDNSDPAIDYFDVNFYLDVELGKWNKPFIDKD